MKEEDYLIDISKDITPAYMLKPRLEWVGKILGMDLYVDTHLEGDYLIVEKKRELAEKILKELTNNSNA